MQTVFEYRHFNQQLPHRVNAAQTHAHNNEEVHAKSMFIHETVNIPEDLIIITNYLQLKLSTSSDVPLFNLRKHGVAADIR